MNNSVLYKYFEPNLYQVDFAQRHMSQNYAFVYIFMHMFTKFHIYFRITDLFTKFHAIILYLLWGEIAHIWVEGINFLVAYKKV